MKTNVDDQCIASTKRLVNLELGTRYTEIVEVQREWIVKHKPFPSRSKRCLEGIRLLLIIVGQITVVVVFI